MQAHTLDTLSASANPPFCAENRHLRGEQFELACDRRRKWMTKSCAISSSFAVLQKCIGRDALSR